MPIYTDAAVTEEAFQKIRGVSFRFSCFVRKGFFRDFHPGCQLGSQCWLIRRLTLLVCSRTKREPINPILRMPLPWDHVPPLPFCAKKSGELKPVTAVLPLLATYLGHTRYTGTGYYVTAGADLLAMAAERALDWGEPS